MLKSKLTVLCCHYTNEATSQDLSDIPAEIEIKRYPCSGRIEVVDILKAFEDGAEAVLVAGCEKGVCHNRTGSARAEKKVELAREILSEIDMNPERVRMAFVPRLDTGAFVAAVKDTFEKLLEIKEEA
ncbi:methyl-viologen-reducing hydrogenase delta subunit [Thermodesulfatator indicus DSM 15286]|uniref:Methyl-viologen-reducing hydrogenase delta subunit n=1 Tax=Thermodesulfatator indicus (strain DSM 15286 / JCM 11887 / CIR29812) TaxID=667014 RepID=F8ADS4_THEID|nr:hydrogenase iron-sulfur subunit [Thermodesulfatator indicus]AEH46034.1 methyl-viologen-reducing hydrogenase delta subunit [Thermodesulfatator indicus DSM 15286]